MRSVANDPESEKKDEAPFVADGLAAGACNEEGVDVTLVRMFLRLTPAERLDEASAAANGIEELRALRSIEARYRHDPRGLVPEEVHLLGPGHDLLQTSCGPLDALGAIDAGLSYDDLLPDSEEIRVEPDVSIRILSLRRIVELETAAGRPKDLAVLPTLRATLAEIERVRGA